MVRLPANKDLCLRCKGGKLLCGLTYCPIVLRTNALLPVRKLLPKMKNEYYGPSPPSLFVGRFGYPNVRLGPMAAVSWEDIKVIDEPDYWQTNFSMEDVVHLRARMFRFIAEPVKVTDVSSSTKILEITQEQIQATNPVNLEATFSKKPFLDLKFDQFTQPMGTRVKINTIKLASTPKIEHKIDRVVSDTDLNAMDAVKDLYVEQSTVTQISRLFSAGLLGEAKKRKFVPTRWSITAVDDILGNNLRQKIQDYPEIQDYMVFHNSYLDNDFWILLIPGREWHFNYHETWKKQSAWNITGSTPGILTDTEGPYGRKKYATNTVGGYYAARLALQEKLARIRRKAAAVVFREVGKGYSIPLGVWQVRENMRKAVNNPPRRFDDLQQALSYVSRKLTIPLQFYHRKSPLLNQKTLNEFF